MKIGKTKVSGIIIAALIISVTVLGAVWYVNKNGGFNVNFGSLDSNATDNGGTQFTSTPPPAVIPENSKDPTSIMATVNPNPVWIGGAVLGEVVSNGYNTGITIKAVHVGLGTAQSIPAWLGTDGKFSFGPQQMNTPGYWQFQVTSDNGIKSNVVSLTVRGTSTVADKEFYSRLIDDSITIQCFSEHKGQTVLFTAVDHELGAETPLGSATINSGGYASITVNLDSLAIKHYELDAVVGSDRASYYGHTAWVQMGR